ncbi:MAG TPA: SH3 domain-containing protein [Novosphingobium sp.]|nr:SH3 domain-containing protein [Novosphingobium sp.]
MKNLLGAATAASLLLVQTADAREPRQAKASNAERLQRQAVADVPQCTRNPGTISIADGDDPYGWTQFQLAPPAKLLRVIVQRSGCFNIVDRGTGLRAAETERNIGSNLGLQRRSNVGQGQIRAAAYVLVAEVQAANRNAGGPVGGLLGGIRSRKLEANTVLSVTNVRTTETLAVVDGYAAKNDVSFGGGGGFFGGVGVGVVGGGYDNTDIGRIVTLAFIDAYSKLVTQLGGIGAGSQGTAEATPTKTFTVTAALNMRRTPAANGALVRTLQPGAIVYPTDNKSGQWWEIEDENGNMGWVLNTRLEPSR